MRARDLLLMALLLGAAPLRAATELVDVAQFRNVLERERGRVVIINVWATWCVPCLREIPDLMRLERAFAGRGVALIGLSMDEPSQLASLVEPFRLKHFPQFRSYLRNAPEMDTLVIPIDPAWNEVLPTTYLLDREGRTARRIQGKRTYEQFQQLLEDILRAKAPVPSRPQSSTN